MTNLPPFALGPYAAISCPVKTQNTFNPLTRSGQVVDPHAVQCFREVTPHRSKVLRFLTNSHEGGVRDIAALDCAQRADACVAAMTEGVPIIVNAEMPIDWTNHRYGVVDVLLRGDDVDGRPSYHPAMIKDHSVLAPTPKGEGNQLVATLDRPFLNQAHASSYRYRIESQADNLLYLAHLWYLIGAAGFGAPQAWGAVIGIDQPDRIHGCLVSWFSLNDKQIRAYSYATSHQWRKYSPLSRYQHEHRFRVRVASHALQQTGSPSDPELVASPVRIPECDECEWWPLCKTALTDDISVKIERSPLDAREIMTLRSLGVSTITDLASTDVDSLLPTYLPRVAHRTGAETRLKLAAHRGRLIADGVKLERLTSGPISMPSALVEIDLDIETSANNHVYLWGFLVDDRRDGESRPYYHCVSRFSPLSQNRELELAEEAASWLADFISSLDDTPALVWHYSSYELSSLRRFARLKGVQTSPGLAWLSAYATDHFVDLFTIVRSNFFGVDGLGLKTIANEGPGFTWRDPDPSGLNSQYWFTDAVHSGSPEQRQAAKERILAYNEDDVRATWTLRQWLRGLT